MGKGLVVRPPVQELGRASDQELVFVRVPKSGKDRRQGHMYGLDLVLDIDLEREWGIVQVHMFYQEQG